MSLRVGIMGTGGTGKSGVASDIAKQLGIKYIAAKTITRPILDRLGYSYSSDVYVEEYLANAERQKEILSLTMAAEKEAVEYVTDRTPIDISAYTMILLYKRPDFVEEIVFACREAIKGYTHLLLCPWGGVNLVPNNIRTLNPWLQFMVHSVIVSLLNDWGIKYTILPEQGDIRVSAAVRAIRA